MARQIPDRDISPVLSAAETWVRTCLIGDGSLFGATSLWTSNNVAAVHAAFVQQPDFGSDDFITKLEGQMKKASPSAQQLMSEMLWALLLFPSNIKAKTKRRQIRAIWALSHQELSEAHPLLSDDVLQGIGSGGTGFNNFRPNELTFLIEIATAIKSAEPENRKAIFGNYDAYIEWIGKVPQEGNRQFRHMLRYFAFPDRVERMSSNQHRRTILDAYKIATPSELKSWTDRQLDAALFDLRTDRQRLYSSEVLDFYSPPLVDEWRRDQLIKTEHGPVPVIVPTDEDDDDSSVDQTTGSPADARKSIQIQAKLAEIGAIMGCRVWVPRNDRARVLQQVGERHLSAFLNELPLNYDDVTLNTIEQIDVIWLRGRSIVRAFEVEHTTAVYSGLLRMADLLALQPNMDIRLHIVAPEERRDKVFREMHRPVFSLLDKGPLAKSCTFLSYDSVIAIREIEHLAYTSEKLIEEYEEKEQ